MLQSFAVFSLLAIKFQKILLSGSDYEKSYQCTEFQFSSLRRSVGQIRYRNYYKYVQ